MLGPESSSSDAGRPKPFRFAVTWSSLTAHLAPCEIGDFREPVSAPVQAVATVVAVPAVEKVAVPEARWEMVVPKMVRPEPRPTMTLQPRPVMQDHSNQLFSRVLTALGRGPRKLLEAPEAQPVRPTGRALQTLGLNTPAPIQKEEGKIPAAAIEQALSRLVRVLNRRAERPGTLEPGRSGTL